MPTAAGKRYAWVRPERPLVALTPLDSLLVSGPTAGNARRAAAEGRAGRFAAARSLLIGGVAAGMLVAVALTGITVMVADIIRSIAEL
jgi:hypothetical protein